MTTLARRLVSSPLGELRLLATDAALVAVLFPDHAPAPGPGPGPNTSDARDAFGHPILDAAAGELAAYFAGRLKRFTTPLEPCGTEFQLRTWRALTAIGFGETRSYAQIAAALGQPTATRAVGAANGLNPLSLFVPCHRVIGADGSLTGYGGGLPAKRWLLEHERRVSDRDFQLTSS